MGMSDCVKCWDTPCTCGWCWREGAIEYLEKQKMILEKAIRWRKEHPNAKFSRTNSEPDTKDDIEYMEAVRKEIKNGV